MRLAMWSGPRNVSTALMRSWGNREDTIVIDEPFYAHYLAVTGAPHPGRDEVLAHQSSDWREVAEQLHAPLPPGVRIFYQKHMSHHLLPNMGREWLHGLTHAFLIRDPREMLLSLDAKLERFGLQDTGLPQQVEIFEFVRRESGVTPPVIDSRDLLRNPEGVLRALCARLDVPFSPSMLSWPPGRRATDGVWAKYWYDRVEQSTGFEPYREPKVRELPAHLAALERECRPLYEQLYAFRISV
ncbi:MAG TPA: hypothetical protein VIL32_09270 [Steroidobacteraceae bacterium]